MRRFLRKIQKALETRMRQQITTTGFVFSLFIVLIGIAAFASANNLLFLLLASMLSTLLVSGFVSRLGLAGLELDIQLPEHLAARKPVHAQLMVKNTKWWTPSFSIFLSGADQSGLTVPIYIPILPGGAELRETVELLFDVRGIYRENTFYFTSRFPFDFTQRRAQVRLEHEVLVYPCIDAQPGFEAMLSDIAGDMESRERGRGLDFYRIRPYEHLESARHVDWKATAHTGDLQVREFAREQDPSVTLFLDLNPADDEDWFETAVDYCAFLIWRLAGSDTRFRFVTQNYDVTIPDEADVYTVLRYLARVEPEAKPGLPLVNEDTSLHIAVSPNLERLSSTAWSDARLISLSELAPAISESRHREARTS